MAGRHWRYGDVDRVALVMACDDLAESKFLHINVLG
jgi:hypothetical protein